MQGTENSLSTNAACVKNLNSYSKRDTEDEGQSLEEDPSGQGNCDEKFFTCVPGLREHHESHRLNKFSHFQDGQILEVGPASNAYYRSQMVCVAEKLATVSIKNNCGSSSSRVVDDSVISGELSEEKVGVLGRKLEAEPYKSRSENNGNLPVVGSSEDPVDPEGVGLESDVKASLLGDCIKLSPFTRCCDNVKVVHRDDDENTIGCNQPCTTSKFSRSSPDIREGRIKKLTASRHWRESQKFNGGKIKQVYCNKKDSYIDDRSQKMYPFKKRKFLSQSPICISDEGFPHENATNSPDKKNGDNCSTETGSSSSVTEQVHPASRGCNGRKAYNVMNCIICFHLRRLLGKSSLFSSEA